MKTSSLVHLMITVCIIYGCSDNSPKSILTDIDSFIQERPDSALAILDTMDRASLKTERLKAHHACCMPWLWIRTLLTFQMIL